MTSPTPLPTDDQKPDDELKPDDIHDGIAREAPEDVHVPMGSHFGALSTEVSSVTPVASNAPGDEPSDLDDQIDISDELTGG